jgi:hypothetical protein
MPVATFQGGMMPRASPHTATIGRVREQPHYDVGDIRDQVSLSSLISLGLTGTI